MTVLEVSQYVEFDGLRILNTNKVGIMTAVLFKIFAIFFVFYRF